MVMATPNETTVRTLLTLIEELENVKDEPIIAEVQTALKKINNLLNPLFLMLTERALLNKPVEDYDIMFSYKGKNVSDFSSVGQFRELMGDERVTAKAINNFKSEGNA